MGKKKKDDNMVTQSKKITTEDSVTKVVDPISYAGIVNVKYMTPDGKEIKFTGHNEGLNSMFRYLCRALCGEFINIAAEKPAFFDMRCSYKNEATSSFETVTCLYNVLSLSNPNYQYDSGLGTWTTTFTIALSYNMINFDVIDNYIANEDTIFYVYLISANGEDFARLQLTDSNLLLTQIVPGTQAIIEWTMVIKNQTKK